MVQFTPLLASLLLASCAVAHPGADVRAEARARIPHLRHPERRTMSSCYKKLEEDGFYKNEITRRSAHANRLREEQGIQMNGFLRGRDLDSASLGSANLLNEREIFAERASCITDPEVTEGPYWVAGELIRKDIREGAKGMEKGVVVNLDINVIDVTTCKPIPNIYVELWGCNSTGVYTGVVAKGNGDGSASEIKNNALRGVQPTNANGTAQFITVVPGHYVGRANHLHTIIHHGATLNANNTISGGTISHVGQFYIEQSMLQTIEKTSPYNTNNQKLTTNAADQLFKTGAGGGDDPVLKVSLLGKTVEEGLYASIEVGVNPKAARKPQPVNMWTANGGIAVPNSMWKGYPWTKKAKRALGL